MNLFHNSLIDVNYIPFILLAYEVSLFLYSSTLCKGTRISFMLSTNGSTFGMELSGIFDSTGISNELNTIVMTAYSGGYPFSISGDIRSLPS